MNEGLEKIYTAFGGKLVGTKHMKQFVCETVAQMPQDIISYVTKTCWFLSSFEDAWAFTFTGNDLKNQHLIFLSDDLLSQHAYKKPTPYFFKRRSFKPTRIPDQTLNRP